MWSAHRGGGQLTRHTAFLVTWLTLGLGLSSVELGQAGQGYTTTVYEGQITSVKIVKCGLQPGLCEGSIILARQGVKTHRWRFASALG